MLLALEWYVSIDTALSGVYFGEGDFSCSLYLLMYALEVVLGVDALWIAGFLLLMYSSSISFLFCASCCVSDIWCSPSGGLLLICLSVFSACWIRSTSESLIRLNPRFTRFKWILFMFSGQQQVTMKFSRNCPVLKPKPFCARFKSSIRVLKHSALDS